MRNSVRAVVDVLLVMMVLPFGPAWASGSTDLPAGRKPFDGPGVTAAWSDADSLQIVSEGRHWILDLRSPDLSQWKWSLSHRFVDYCGFWTEAGDPAPWSDGITAAWNVGTGLALVSKDRFWTLDTTNGKWGDKGTLFSEHSIWKLAPKVEGFAPWDEPGVTAGWVLGQGFTVVSRDKYWAFDLTNGTWSGSGYLKQADVWEDAPQVRDSKGNWVYPWDGTGITATYTMEQPYKMLVVISEDKFWVLDMTKPNYRDWTWPAAGMLQDIGLWADAPVVRESFAGFKPDCQTPLQDFSVFEHGEYIYVSAFRKRNGHGFKYARSKDLVEWEDLGIILVDRGVHDPDGGTAPHVFEHQGTYYQYFTGVETVGPSLWDQKILMATTTDPSDPQSWTKNNSFVFTPTHHGALWTPGTGAACRDPMVLYAGKKWHMYYTGYDYNNGVTRGIVGRAEATSPGGPWFDKGAVLTVNSGAPESAFVTRAPDGTYVLTFNHSTPEGKEGTQLATSDSPAGPFTIERRFGPGWAHEWLETSDGTKLAAYLTGYWVNFSRFRWRNNRPIIE